MFPKHLRTHDLPGQVESEHLLQLGLVVHLGAAVLHPVLQHGLTLHLQSTINNDNDNEYLPVGSARPAEVWLDGDYVVATVCESGERHQMFLPALLSTAAPPSPPSSRWVR